MSGLIYNIQRFAVHDGPGIRTLVYMKGCPLECLWCSSPQTQKNDPELLHIETHCQKCGLCFQACQKGAIEFSEAGGPGFDRKVCDCCGSCVDACLNQALEIAGKPVSVDELFIEVDKDSAFYRRSKGGVTIGGGEPTMQHEFVSELLKKCQKKYIHTVIETCGFVKFEHLEKLLENLDLVYMDIKHMDAITHKKITGVSNRIILENARKVSAIRPLILRIPVIPGLNDSDENIHATADFAASLSNKFQRIELLPYHKFGTQTYEQLGMEYQLADTESPTDEHMQRLKSIVESCGVTAQIGG